MKRHETYRSAPCDIFGGISLGHSERLTTAVFEKASEQNQSISASQSVKWEYPINDTRAALVGRVVHE